MPHPVKLIKIEILQPQGIAHTNISEMTLFWCLDLFFLILDLWGGGVFYYLRAFPCSKTSKKILGQYAEIACILLT